MRSTLCLSIADLRSCCRLYILPDNTESRAHAQWRRTVCHVTRSWLHCCWLRRHENRKNMALTVWTPQSLCVCVSVECSGVQPVSFHASKYSLAILLQGNYNPEAYSEKVNPHPLRNKKGNKGNVFRAHHSLTQLFQLYLLGVDLKNGHDWIMCGLKGTNYLKQCYAPKMNA